MTRRLTNFIRLPLREKALALIAWPLIGMASALLLAVPFRRIAWLLGTPQGAIGYIPLADLREIHRARLVRRAITRAASVAPFRADCLPQAMAAAVMARALGVPLSIHLGVQLEEGAMLAHAWSSTGPVAVSGGRSFGDYTIVGCFVTGGQATSGRTASPSRRTAGKAAGNAQAKVLRPIK